MKKKWKPTIYPPIHLNRQKTTFVEWGMWLVIGCNATQNRFSFQKNYFRVQVHFCATFSSFSLSFSLSLLPLSLPSLSIFLDLFLYISLYLSANFNYHQPLAAPVNVLSTWCAHALQVNGTPGFYSHALCRNKIVGLLDNCSIGFMTLSNFCSIVWLSLSSAVFGENSCRKIGWNGVKTNRMVSKTWYLFSTYFSTLVKLIKI